MLVKEYMSKNVICVEENTSVIDATKIMKENNIHRIPIIGNGKLVGIITDRDLRSAAPSQVISFDKVERELMPELHSLLAHVEVKTVMSRDVITTIPDSSIFLAAALMLEHLVSCLPVLDSKGKMVGIITEVDLLKVLHIIGELYSGRIVLVLKLQNRPGSIKEVEDIIRENGSRIITINSFSGLGAESTRDVLIRISQISSEKLEELKKKLEKMGCFRYVLQEHIDKQ